MAGEDERRRRSAEQNRRSGNDSVSGFSGAAVGAHAARRQAAASEIFSEELKKFLKEAGKNTPKKQLKGNLFEYIEAAKFNRNAVAAGKSTRARLTADMGRSTDPTTDVVLGSKPLQLKTGKQKYIVDGARNQKYAEVEKVTTIDKVDSVNQKLESLGEETRVSGELKSKGVSSGGTTVEELSHATDNPEQYARIETAKQIGREAIETGVYAAEVAAVIGGTESAVKNGLAYRDGKIDGEQALANIGKDTMRSGLRGGATGALGVGVRHGARNLGVPIKSNIATSVAALAIEIGVTVHDFAKGEISAEEAGERIGETGCSAAGGMYVGLAAGAIFGLPGAMVGSMVGYMATAWTYQSCIAILKQARLAEDEAGRVEALCAESLKECNRWRQEFESRVAAYLEKRHVAFHHCFSLIDEALEADETDNAVAGLALLAGMTGSACKLEGFEEFKRFMTQDENTPLII